MTNKYFLLMTLAFQSMAFSMQKSEEVDRADYPALASPDWAVVEGLISGKDPRVVLQKSPKNFLSECDTVDCPMSRNNYCFRSWYEDVVLLQIIKLKDQPRIRYTSFASGGLFQDAIILIKAIKEFGIKNLDIYLIEPWFNCVDSMLLKAKFVAMIKYLSRGESQVHFYNSATEYLLACLNDLSCQADVLAAMDISWNVYPICISEYNLLRCYGLKIGGVSVLMEATSGEFSDWNKFTRYGVANLAINKSDGIFYELYGRVMQVCVKRFGCPELDIHISNELFDSQDLFGARDLIWKKLENCIGSEWLKLVPEIGFCAIDLVDQWRCESGFVGTIGDESIAASMRTTSSPTRLPEVDSAETVIVEEVEGDDKK